MKSRSLLTPATLAKLIADDACLVVDCRFDLGQPEKGYRDYLAGHIPGARYADLNRDLSSPVTSTSGRHPLPGADQFASFLARLAWAGDKLLVAYDERNSTMAVRLWWLMRYFGQPAAILDGGLNAWVAAGMELESGESSIQPTVAPLLSKDSRLTASADEIMAMLGGSGMILVDARARERFAGETEPLDQKAGHIPGALNRPTTENLDPTGQFKTPELLRLEFDRLLKASAANTVVNTCGSGVTACHNAFAMELAGLGLTRIYPGSWSEWIRDDSRPIEVGPDSRNSPA